MNKNEPATIANFFRKNLWNIVVILFVSAIGFVVLQKDVKNLTKRVSAVELHQAEYPSKEWFDLKFESEREYVNLKFENLEKKIDNSNR